MGSTGDRTEKVLVLGDNFPATPIIHTLTQHTNYDLHIAHPHVPAIPNKHATYHTIRISPAELTPLLIQLQPDVVVNTFPSGPTASKNALIDAIVAAGIKRFIPSEFGHDSLNPRIQERLTPSKEKAGTIQYLEQLSRNGKISWVAVAVGTVLDRGILSKNLGFDLAWKNANLNGSGAERFPASSADWIGRVVLAALRNWEKVQNRYLHAAGLVTSATEVVKCLELQTGKEWTVDRGDVEQCVREAEKRIEMGFPDAGMFLMERSLLYDMSLGAAGPFEEEGEEVRRQLGLDQEGLEGVVEGVVHEYEHHGAGGKASCGCD